MDTIVAVATPPGRSAIGLIRLSGPASLKIACSLVHDEDFNPKPAHALLRKLKQNGSDEVLDQALVTYFEAPNSFTGEDMVEISCHGSPVILKQLLDLIQSKDARLASPGEFTLRACRNGKLNLSQAEAIRDLINARTEAAAVQATRQLGGELSVALQPSKERIIRVIVSLESALEFVEDDLPKVERQALELELVALAQVLGELASSFGKGRLLREGLNVAIVGRPNVGKSSLFNSLLGRRRAIVTDIPGTTRDSLTETIALKGVPVSLTDTAGMREASDKIEEIGVKRTHEAIADADLLLVVIDGSTDLAPEDREVLSGVAQRRHLVVINKADLPKRSGANAINGQAKIIEVSALAGEGLDELSAAILDAFSVFDSESAGVLITNSRHYDLLLRAQSSLESAVALIQKDASEELVLVGLYNGLKFLGEITGETTSEDILTEIFSTFCIGK